MTDAYAKMFQQMMESGQEDAASAFNPALENVQVEGL
jgi:hypothetical protein